MNTQGTVCQSRCLSDLLDSILYYHNNDHGWLLRERPNFGLSRSLPDPESVCTDTSILLFGNVLNAYLINHNIILLNIDGCEYCICRYLFDCILTWVLIKSSVCLSVCLSDQDAKLFDTV